ncbi:MAG: PilT/PilU family type 4a pilus ATPase, partial [Candidatus Eremiobacteraeota bacterium]|nr:PilT/PilU family type 4a pilus ATPase [Candidatus Eremiobacteraeota bacterium]
PAPVPPPRPLSREDEKHAPEPAPVPPPRPLSREDEFHAPEPAPVPPPRPLSREDEKHAAVPSQVPEGIQPVNTILSKAAGGGDELKDILNSAREMKAELRQVLDESRLMLAEAEQKVRQVRAISEENRSYAPPPAAPPPQAAPQPFIHAGIEIPERSDLDVELDDILKLLVYHKGSDLHLKVGSPPVTRIEGELIPVGSQNLTAKDTQRLILRIMNPDLVQSLLRKKEIDFSYEVSCGRFRVNAFLQKSTVSASLRLVKSQIPNFKQLYLPSTLEKIVDFHDGLFLVTGSAGSGKSTTLAAMINFLNESKKYHVITIEDPVEYVFEDKQCIITQREVGIDTESFRDALKMALRQDPNVIMIGELRDTETVSQAIMAAETGHLILATLHTPNTIQAVRRLLDFFPSEQQKTYQASLASTLRGIISQKLIKRIDQDERIPAVELMFATPTISSLIREGNLTEIYQYIKDGMSEGMITFTESLTRLFKTGCISRESALFNAEQATEVRLTMAENEGGGSIDAPDAMKSSWWHDRL